MLVVSIDYVPDKEFILLGIVQGSAIHSKSQATHLQYLNAARHAATESMIAEAKTLKADAIINVRLSSHTLDSDITEILTYGTAVKFKVTDTLQQF